MMFSDGSTFILVRGVPKMVRRSSSASQYDPKLTIKSTKHPGSVMMWAAFKGRVGLYFLPKNVTMKGSIYINILKKYLLTFRRIHQCDYFMHDGTTTQRSLQNF